VLTGAGGESSIIWGKTEMLSASRSKAMVLVVEDDDVTCELLTQLLLTSGFDVVAAPTGEWALLALCQHSEEIDWLVSKVSLPGLVCGWILADEYRQHHPDRPVILIPPIFELTKMSSGQVVFVPPGAPMRVLEVLQALRTPETACVLSFREAKAA
jgi:PleD family two-component response regulator